jgi:hypothetical protein
VLGERLLQAAIADLGEEIPDGAFAVVEVIAPALEGRVQCAWYQYVPDCRSLNRYTKVLPGSMPGKLNPGTPSMSAGTSRPCQ